MRKIMASSLKAIEPPLSKEKWNIRNSWMTFLLELVISTWHDSWSQKAAAGSDRWCLRMCRPKTEHCNQMSWLLVEGTRNFHTLHWHTLNYITLHYITMITLRSVTLHCSALKYSALQQLSPTCVPQPWSWNRHCCWVNCMTSHLYCIALYIPR